MAEIVENPLPKDRDRTQLHHATGYYALRNRLIDFLVTRSKTLRDAQPEGYDQRHPPVVRPSLSASDADAIAAGTGPAAKRA